MAVSRTRAHRFEILDATQVRCVLAHIVHSARIGLGRCKQLRKADDNNDDDDDDDDGKDGHDDDNDDDDDDNDDNDDDDDNEIATRMPSMARGALHTKLWTSSRPTGRACGCCDSMVVGVHNLPRAKNSETGFKRRNAQNSAAIVVPSPSVQPTD
jgi:ABC-type Zn2+ transport system substrate-binding protein/surface adhesin